MGHTKTPWQIGFSDGSGADETGWCIVADGNEAVVFSGESFGASYGIKKKVNAAFIVTACNAHDELVAALDSILRRATPHQLDTPEDRERDLLHIEHEARMALVAIDRAKLSA